MFPNPIPDELEEEAGGGDNLLCALRPDEEVHKGARLNRLPDGEGVMHVLSLAGERVDHAVLKSADVVVGGQVLDFGGKASGPSLRERVVVGLGVSLLDGPRMELAYAAAETEGVHAVLAPELAVDEGCRLRGPVIHHGCDVAVRAVRAAASASACDAVR
jgi:hypothetical protein